MRILLAEDDRRIANLVSKGLRENSYAVDVANDGEEALYQVSINDYDLIILDVMMPLKDGFEVCQELRNSGNKTPILILTARDAVEDRISGLDFGADDYLVKPFEFSELLARLRALLRRKSEIRPPKIVIADLEIDTVSQKVWRGGNEILLTTKEYALLEYMAREKGKAVAGRACAPLRGFAAARRRRRKSWLTCSCPRAAPASSPRRRRWLRRASTSRRSPCR